MATSIDTNVVVALWQGEEQTAQLVEDALQSAASIGGLVICGAVYAELLAYPGRTRTSINEFCEETGITIDWTINDLVWIAAGTAYQKYSTRRRKNRIGSPRRILADFLIGAHACENGLALLTLDNSIFKSAFPTLEIARV